MSPEFEEAVVGVGDQLDALGYSEQYALDSTLDHPKLHLKANLLASKVAWDGLVSRPEWGVVLRGYIKYLAEISTRQHEPGEMPESAQYPEEMVEGLRSLITNYVSGLTQQAKKEIILYLSVGSVNMDYRSMVMDGEVMILLSKWQALHGMIDFMLLAGLCEWPETLEELNALLPPGGGFTRSMAGLMKLAM